MTAFEIANLIISAWSQGIIPDLFFGDDLFGYWGSLWFFVLFVLKALDLPLFFEVIMDWEQESNLKLIDYIYLFAFEKVKEDFRYFWAFPSFLGSCFFLSKFVQRFISIGIYESSLRVI